MTGFSPSISVSPCHYRTPKLHTYLPRIILIRTGGRKQRSFMENCKYEHFHIFYIWSDYLLSRPHYGNPTAHWFLYHCFVLSCLSETLSSLSLSKHSSFLQIMCTKSDPVSILSILFLFVPSVGIHFPSPCNHYRTTLAAVLILHGMCSCVERTNHGNVQVQCSIQRLKITY